MVVESHNNNYFLGQSGSIVGFYVARATLDASTVDSEKDRKVFRCEIGGFLVCRRPDI